MQGTAIIGTEDVPGGTDTPLANAGLASDVNDDDFTSRVDTWNGGNPDTQSYVGILWSSSPTNPVVRLQLNLAIFFDGGWFGPNNAGPGSGGFLSTNQYLVEPSVQASGDGLTWTNVLFASDYLTTLEGYPLPAVDFGAPTRATTHFRLTPPLSNIAGIRIIGSEGGIASGGFLGVFELAVYTGGARSVRLLNPRIGASQFTFEFDSQAGVGHVVQFKNSLGDANWQTFASSPAMARANKSPTTSLGYNDSIGFQASKVSAASIPRLHTGQQVNDPAENVSNCKRSSRVVRSGSRRCGIRLWK